MGGPPGSGRKDPKFASLPDDRAEKARLLASSHTLERCDHQQPSLLDKAFSRVSESRRGGARAIARCPQLIVWLSGFDAHPAP